MTPDAKLRMEVYQEGQRAFSSKTPCPYSDWRWRTWAEGYAAARSYMSQDIARQETALAEGDQRDAERYRKLRRWMTSNMKEGWTEVEHLGAIGSWMGWHDFDAALDALAECSFGMSAGAPADNRKTGETGESRTG